MKTHQHLQNHNAWHIERIKEGTIIATSIEPMDAGCPGNWEKTKGYHFKPILQFSRPSCPPKCQNPLLSLPAFDDQTFLIPFLIIPDVIFSQPPTVCSSCPIPPSLQSFVLTYILPQFSYFHSSGTGVPEMNLKLSLSFFVSPFLPLPLSLFLPPLLPPSLAHPSSLYPSSGVPSVLEDHLLPSPVGLQFLLTPVQDDVLLSQTAVLHSATQASRLPSRYIQGYSEIPSPVSIGHDVPLLSARLLLLTPHPHHPHRFGVES